MVVDASSVSDRFSASVRPRATAVAPVSASASAPAFVPDAADQEIRRRRGRGSEPDTGTDGSRGPRPFPFGRGSGHGRGRGRRPPVSRSAGRGCSRAPACEACQLEAGATGACVRRDGAEAVAPHVILSDRSADRRGGSRRISPELRPPDRPRLRSRSRSRSRSRWLWSRPASATGSAAVTAAAAATGSAAASARGRPQSPPFPRPRPCPMQQIRKSDIGGDAAANGTPGPTGLAGRGRSRSGADAGTDADGVGGRRFRGRRDGVALVARPAKPAPWKLALRGPAPTATAPRRSPPTSS